MNKIIKPNGGKLVWVSLHCRRGKDFLLIESFKKHPLIYEALFFGENGVIHSDQEQEKNLWPGMVFIKTMLFEGKISKDLKDFLFSNPFFARFYTYKHNYLGNPIILSDREIKRMVKDLQATKKTTIGKFKSQDVDFKINEFVTVLSGVFRGYEGEVVEIDYNTGIITLSIEFFGRITPIQVGFLECKKIV